MDKVKGNKNGRLEENKEEKWNLLKNEGRDKVKNQRKKEK